MTHSISFTPAEPSSEHLIKFTAQEKKRNKVVDKALKVAKQGAGGFFTGGAGNVSSVIGPHLAQRTTLPLGVEKLLGGAAEEIAPPSAGALSQDLLSALSGGKGESVFQGTPGEAELAQALGLEEPEGILETGARRGGSALGRALTSGPLGLLRSLILGGAGAGGGAVESVTQSPALGAGTELLLSILGGSPAQNVKFSPRQNQLIEAGKRFGASAEDLTPLLHEPATVKGLSYLTPKGKSIEKAKEYVQNLGTKAIKDVKTAAESESGASVPETLKFLKKVKSLKNEFSKHDLHPSSEDEKALKFFDDVIKRSLDQGIHPSNLVRSYRTANKTINWRDVKNGKEHLKQYRNLLDETIKDVSTPEFYDLFKKGNLIYSKQKDFIKSLRGDVFSKAIDKSKYPAILAKSLAGALIGAKYISSLKSGGAALAAAYLTPRAAGKFLSTPGFVNLPKKFSMSLKHGSINKASQYLDQAADLLGPEIVEEISENQQQE